MGKKSTQVRIYPMLGIYQCQPGFITPWACNTLGWVPFQSHILARYISTYIHPLWKWTWMEMDDHEFPFNEW
jgi:hypothetical protein